MSDTGRLEPWCSPTRDFAEERDNPQAGWQVSVPREAAGFSQAMEISNLWISVLRLSNLSSKLDFLAE